MTTGGMIECFFRRVDAENLGCRLLCFVLPNGRGYFVSYPPAYREDSVIEH